jgi:protein-S-isoprenylcysteine O-methyltransferase Ste14
MTWLIPPRLLVVLSLLMILLHWLAPLATVVPPHWNLTGVLLMAGGFGMGLAIARRFRDVDTEINTFKTPRKLVTDGLFGVTRNPIYLGMTIFLIGLAVFLGTASPWAGPVMFFLVANAWYIPVEERNAAKHFGEDYAAYRARVRRWL